MQVSYGLPTHRVDRIDEFLTASAVGELAAAAERAGFGAVYTTEHPFPGDEWLAHGGHHALDPLVALAFAAAATERIRLHTNLFVAAYRNPFLAAKGVATLDVLSGGHVRPGDRGRLPGRGVRRPRGAVRRAQRPYRRGHRRHEGRLVGWERLVTGTGFSAAGNTMLPRPAQRPHPPLWIGGNSLRAVRRAVESADGWSPFPSPRRTAAATRTAPLESVGDLAGRLAYAADHARAVGRTSRWTWPSSPTAWP